MLKQKAAILILSTVIVSEVQYHTYLQKDYFFCIKVTFKHLQKNRQILKSLIYFCRIRKKYVDDYVLISKYMFSFIAQIVTHECPNLLSTKWYVLIIVNTNTITDVAGNTWNTLVKVSYVILYVMAESATGKY